MKRTFTTTSSATAAGGAKKSSKTTTPGVSSSRTTSRTQSTLTNSPGSLSASMNSKSQGSGNRRTLGGVAKGTTANQQQQKRTSSGSSTTASSSRPGTARNNNAANNANNKKKVINSSPRTIGSSGSGGGGGASSKSSPRSFGKNKGLSPRKNQQQRFFDDSDASGEPSPHEVHLTGALDEKETKEEKRLRKTQERAQKKQQLKKERQEAKEKRLKLEKIRVARATKNTKIPDWLLLGAPEILESFEHPVELATLMATNRQVRDKVVLPNIHDQFGPIAAGFVLSSKEYLPAVENPRPVTKLEKKISKEIRRKFDGYCSSDDEEDDEKDSDDDEKMNLDDTDIPTSLAKKEDTGEFKNNSLDDDYDDEAHTASSLLKLFSADTHIVPSSTGVFNLNGAALPDKKSGDIFFRSILAHLLKDNEKVKRAEFGLLKKELLTEKERKTQHTTEQQQLTRKDSSLDENPKTAEMIEFEEEGRKIISHIKYPVGGELSDQRIADFNRENRDVGLVNDRTISLLGQRNQKLRYLDISGRTEVTGVGLSVIACCCTKLLHLNLSWTTVTDASMCLLASYCRHLKNLAIEGCEKVTDRAVSSVSIWCPGLQSLNVSRTKGKITDLSLGEIIARCHYLERLVAHSCDGGVTDATLMALGRPPFVTNAALFTEREMDPDEKIEMHFSGSVSPSRRRDDDDEYSSNNNSPGNHNQFNNSSIIDSMNASTSSTSLMMMNSNASKHSSTKPQAPCLWTTLKEVDVRGANGKVTWTGGMLNVLQHTATEHEKRRRINMRKLRMQKQQQQQSSSDSSPQAATAEDSSSPRLIVYVDIDVLDEVPEQSPVLANVKGMLKFASVIDF